jgi:alkaline phosphatase
VTRRVLPVVLAGLLLLGFQAPLAAPALAGTRPLARNVILVIGDGMGLAQLTSGLVAAGGSLAMEGFPVVGLAKTFSSDRFVTDSAAAATALACGVKTKNGAIGVDSSGRRVSSLVELARRKGMKTGVVVTSSITHATPAAFYAHQSSRKNDEAIADDLLASGLDLFIGGGRRFLGRRCDGVDLLAGLEAAGYDLVTDPRGLATAKGTRLAGLLADEDLPTITDGRGSFLPDSVKLALARLPGPRGFFLMVEGSQIDYGAHDQDAPRTAAEVVDLDQVVARALAFARSDQRTLVVVTADHETGGFALTTGSLEKSTVDAKFATKDHTATMVPVFAFGPGAGAFAGIYENTGVFDRIRAALGL